MELGGNAPCIVFDDADIDVAVKGSVSKKLLFLTSTTIFGSCISTNIHTKKIMISSLGGDEHHNRYDEFVLYV